jgi:hypothetical protein
MRILETNDDYKFDVDLSQLLTMVDDKNLFHKKEESSFKSLNKLITNKVELKSQDRSKNFIWLEYGIVENGIYKDSGISTSEAEVYRITIGQVVLEFTSNYLKWLVLKREELDIPECKNNAENYIGYGINIPLAQILHYQKQYFQSQEYRKYLLKSLKLL